MSTANQKAGFFALDGISFFVFVAAEMLPVFFCLMPLVGLCSFAAQPFIKVFVKALRRLESRPGKGAKTKPLNGQHPKKKGQRSLRKP